MSNDILEQTNSSVNSVPCPKREEDNGEKLEGRNNHHLCRTTAYPRYCRTHDRLYDPCLCGCRPDDCPRCLADEWEKAFDRDDPHAEHGDWQTPNVHACCDGHIETQIGMRHQMGTPYTCPHCRQPYCADCDIEVQP